MIYLNIFNSNIGRILQFQSACLTMTISWHLSGRFEQHILHLAHRKYLNMAYLPDEAAIILSFAFTLSSVKKKIISVCWNEFDSVFSLAQNKQKQQGFGLAFWCPLGVGLWAKMKICTVWFWGKDVFHPVTFSSGAAFLPAFCFHPSVPH